MKALLLENDETHAQTIAERLKVYCGFTEVTSIHTELDFRRSLQDLITKEFNLAIFDVMVPWCKVEDLDKADAAVPPEVQAEHDALIKKRGGLRCKQSFQEGCARMDFRQVPVILYTVLEQYDLSEEIDCESFLLVKHGDRDEFIEYVRAIISI